MWLLVKLKPAVTSSLLSTSRHDLTPSSLVLLLSAFRRWHAGLPHRWSTWLHSASSLLGLAPHQRSIFHRGATSHAPHLFEVYSANPVLSISPPPMPSSPSPLTFSLRAFNFLHYKSLLAFLFVNTSLVENCLVPNVSDSQKSKMKSRRVIIHKARRTDPTSLSSDGEVERRGEHTYTYTRGVDRGGELHTSNTTADGGDDLWTQRVLTPTVGIRA